MYLVLVDAMYYYISCFDKALLFISPVNPSVIVMMIT